MIVYRYDGTEIEVETTAGIAHVRRCYNPFCQCFVQVRPENDDAAGRPKMYCTERCRYRWKGKRRAARNSRIRSINTLYKEEHHGRDR